MGSDAVAINDGAFTGGDTYTITDATVSLPNSLGEIVADYSALEHLILNTGNGADSIQVESTAAGTAVDINAGGGDDLIEINQLDSGASVLVNGVTGSDRLLLQDGQYVRETYTAVGAASGTIALQVSPLVFIPPATVTYFGVERIDDLNTGPGAPPVQLANNLVFNATAGSDTINAVNGPTVNGVPTVQINSGNGTFATLNFAHKTSATINGLAGNDALNVGSAAFAGVSMTLNGNGGDDTLGGPLATNAWAVTAANAGTLNGMSFGTMENLQGSIVADQFTFSVGGSISGAVRGGILGGDTLNYSAFTTAVNVNLGTGVATAIAGGVSEIENVTGGANSDVLTGSFGNNVLIGGAGNDTLEGGPGVDTMQGDLGNDVYVFGAVGVILETDTVVELAGGGSDLLSFTALAANDPVTVDLGNDNSLASHIRRVVRTGAAGQAANFERATGGAGNDQLTGNAMQNVLNGGAGNDTLVGLGAADTLEGGSGSDTVRGGVGNDLYVFRNAAASETDTLVELAGQGTDHLTFGDFAAANPVIVNLTSDTALATHTNRTVQTGAAGQAANFENVTTGAGHDRLTGNAASNTFNAGMGNDIVLGNAGDDVLNGGGGQDLLIGGTGVDSLRGNDGEDLLLGGQTIHDSNTAALDAIMSEWGRNLAYQDRIDHLTGAVPGGNNGSVLLNANTVLDDNGAADTLEGGFLLDWFFQDLNDTVSDPNNGGPETVTII
jgi:Ca2+-binding RTX toxin-like protein